MSADLPQSAARLAFGAAEPDPALRPGVNVPGHIRALAGRSRGA